MADAYFRYAILVASAQRFGDQRSAQVGPVREMAVFNPAVPHVCKFYGLRAGPRQLPKFLPTFVLATPPLRAHEIWRAARDGRHMLSGMPAKPLGRPRDTRPWRRRTPSLSLLLGARHSL